MRKTVYAGLVVLAALTWQSLTVRVNYGGNWTALFCTGDTRPVPPSLAGEPIYIFRHSNGYDGQFYHYIAHEPWPGGRISPYVEAPQMRYRRILLPGLAWLLSGGRAGAVHVAYIGAGMMFLFLGTWWLGAYLEGAGLRPEWCLLFPLLPSSLVFVDRLTVDVALAALTMAFLLYTARSAPGWKLYAVCLLAPLARETGLALVAAECAFQGRRHRWRRTALFATAALPWLGWSAYIRIAAPGGGYHTALVPLGSLLHRLVHPIHYPASVPLAPVVQAADALALAGLLLAIAMGLYLGLSRRFEPAATAALLFSLAAVFIQGRGLWHSVYSYGRVFSPLLLVVLVAWLPSRRWLAVAPLALVLPRVAMQFGPQILGVAGALLHS